MADKKKGTRKRLGTDGHVKISAAKQEQMFQAWCELQSVRGVSRKCAAHHKTVARYRRLNKWDERLNEIKAQANVKADRKIAGEQSKLIANYRAIRNAGLNHFLKELKAQIEAGKDPELPLGIKSLSMLERLIAFLEGKPDSRPDLPAVPLESAGQSELCQLLATLNEKLGGDGAKVLADQLAGTLTNEA